MIKYLGIEEVGFIDDGYIDYDRNGYGLFELINFDEILMFYLLIVIMNKLWDNGIFVVIGYNYSYVEDV